jgi:AMP-binding enzyme
LITPLPGIVSTKPGSATSQFPGVSADVVDEREGKSISDGQGLLVIKRPWPAMLRTLYKEDDRFVEAYFSRFGKETYLVGDAARRDKDGYFWIIGRIDDVVNVSGHRLSTAEVESAIVSHQKVAEAAAIGQSDEDTGQAICAFVTLQGTTEGSDPLIEDIRAHVARRIGKFARPKGRVVSPVRPAAVGCADSLQTPSSRPSSATWRRAIGIVCPSPNASSAVPPRRGRTSTARLRLATYWRWMRTKPWCSQRRSISFSVARSRKRPSSPTIRTKSPCDWA